MICWYNNHELVFETFRSVLEKPHFSPLGERKKQEYIEITSDREPLFLYSAPDLMVEFYEERGVERRLDHPFRGRNYLVRFTNYDQSQTGFLEATESQVDFIDQKLIEEIDADAAYKKIVRDFA